MSRRRKTPAQRRAAVVALTVALVAAALLLLLLGRLITGALNATRAGGSGARDPQFAEPTEVVTRPPEADAVGWTPDSEEDPSAGWDEGTLTPVDKTADELGREAAAAG